MELAKILLLLILGAVVAQASRPSFNDYENQFKKNYKNNEERQKRNKIFNSRMDQIDSLNQQAISSGSSERYGPTEFSDKDDDELSSFTGFKPSASGILKQSLQVAPEMSNIRSQAVASSLGILASSWDCYTKHCLLLLMRVFDSLRLVNTRSRLATKKPRTMRVNYFLCLKYTHVVSFNYIFVCHV